MAKIGTKIMSDVMIEWVGPLCSMNGIRRSMSGTTDSMRTNGMLSSVFSSLDEALLERYPNARCPTAKRCLFLLL